MPTVMVTLTVRHIQKKILNSIFAILPNNCYVNIFTKPFNRMTSETFKRLDSLSTK